MNTQNAELYSRHNRFQRFLAEIPWRQLTSFSGEELPIFDKVLDLGCGTGEVTKNLATFLANLERKGGRRIPQCVVGIDASPEMIKFCRKTTKELKDANEDDEEGNASAPRNDVFALKTSFDFRVADFDRPFPADWNWSSRFDLVTSHSALHFVGDLPAALDNVRSSLRSGGHFLFTLVIRAAEPYLVAGQRTVQKWASYIPENIMDNLPPIISQLRGDDDDDDDDDDDPVKKFRKTVMAAGLNLFTCKLDRGRYVFADANELRGTLEPLYPHVRHLTPEMKEELVDDLVEEYGKVCEWVVEDGVEKATWDVEFLIVHGEKP